MAVVFPFFYACKYSNPNKITLEEETAFWVNSFDTTNNLVSRCNTKNSKTIPLLGSPITVQSKGGPMTKEDYDANMTALETKFNQLIAASTAQAVNPANTVSLIKMATLKRTMLIHERDTNCSTVQVFLNSLNQLYHLVGA